MSQPMWRVGETGGITRGYGNTSGLARSQSHKPTVTYVKFLDCGDSYRLGSFGSLLNLELNTLVFLE